MKTTIRFGKNTDLAQAIQLSENTNDWREYWSNERWRTLLIRDYKRAIRDKSFLIAVCNKRVVGQILWAEIGTFVYFEEIAIAEHFKHKGLGSKLFKKAQQIISCRGFEHFITDTYVGNTTSLKFQEKHGMKICGGVQYLWDDSPYLLLGKSFDTSKEK